MPQEISISSLQDGLQTAIGEVSEFITEHPIGVAAGAAGVVALGTGLVVAARIRRKKKAKRKVKKKVKRISRRRKLRFGSAAYRKKYCRNKRKHKKRYSKQKKPYTAGKRKDTSRRRIRYTKNNQPYVILASGKARFISKKSARHSRRRKGGRY